MKFRKVEIRDSSSAIRRTVPSAQRARWGNAGCHQRLEAIEQQLEGKTSRN